jgi:hypothetical protein
MYSIDFRQKVLGHTKGGRLDVVTNGEAIHIAVNSVFFMDEVLGTEVKAVQTCDKAGYGGLDTRCCRLP